MNGRTLLSLCATCMFVAGIGHGALAQETSLFAFTEETSFFIDGTSSLHDWTCTIPVVRGAFTTSEAQGSEGFGIDTGDVSILVEDIDCGKRIMNGKLSDALRKNGADSIDFRLQAANVTAGADSSFSMVISGMLTIAGIPQSIEVTAQGRKRPDGTIHFEGSRKLLQTDYGIDPPTALLGRLKTGDEVTVRFVVIAASM